MKCGGLLTTDRQAWGEALNAYCSAKFCDADFTVGASNDLVAQLDLDADAAEAVGWHSPKLTLPAILLAKTSLRTGKVAGGRDLVVTELIQALPQVLVYVLADLFARRLGGDREALHSWDTILMVFFAKFAGATDFADFRGIPLLSCIRKWYVACILGLIAEYPLRYPWNQAMALGFTKGMSINLITSPLRCLLQK